NSAAGLMLIEDTWAIPLKEAILNAGAVARAGGLVAPELVESIEAEIAAEAAKQKENEYVKKTSRTPGSSENRRSRRYCLCSRPSCSYEIGTAATDGCPAECTDCRCAGSTSSATAASSATSIPAASLRTSTTGCCTSTFYWLE